ncbi:MAG TPA: ATP-binding protein [Candidatus Acidoferrum sp.]|nr:ATP-binding protein [Candidatus Acidoferrum sp.]
MNKANSNQLKTSWFAAQWPGLIIWAIGWTLMPIVNPWMTLGTMAMLLLLTATVAALWLRPRLTLALCAITVVVFNFLFVPSRLPQVTDPWQIPLMLVVMFSVSVLVTMLMTLVRDHASKVEHQAQSIEMLRNWSDILRDATDVQDCVTKLQELLASVAKASVTVMTLRAGRPQDDDPDDAQLAGEAAVAELDGLWQCLRGGHTLGAVAGHHPTLPHLYLPLRGRGMSYGAALVRTDDAGTEVRSQLQALCDQMGAALERQHWQRQQQEADQMAREQTLRTTLLTAIAHDYRTPLATIMGAASSLEHQDARLNREQRQQLAHRIVEESVRLRQMTANILELVRLDAPGVQLQCDWQSADELVESVVKRCREPQRLKLEVASALPLLWCDALLVSQLLDNLVDNACKYSTPGSPIRLSVGIDGNAVAFRIIDKGPGIPEELQQLVFQPFRQGQALVLGGRTGVGLGLALCRIVAAAHNGELTLQSLWTGTCFEFRLPRREPPAQPEQEEAA